MGRHRHQRIRQINRLGRRDINLPQNAHPAASLDTCGFFKFKRYGFEGLTQQENAKCAGHIGQADAKGGIKQAQFGNYGIVFDNQNFWQDEQLQQHQNEKGITAAERKPGKGKTGQCAQNKLTHQDQGHKRKRIDEIADPRHGIPDINEILQGQWCTEIKFQCTARRLQCRPKGK